LTWKKHRWEKKEKMCEFNHRRWKSWRRMEKDGEGWRRMEKDGEDGPSAIHFISTC
jgi:hypothetical protein